MDFPGRAGARDHETAGSPPGRRARIDLLRAFLLEGGLVIVSQREGSEHVDARTIVQWNGDVIVHVCDEALRAPALLDEHLADVRRTLAPIHALLGRSRRLGSVIGWGTGSACVLSALSAAASGGGLEMDAIGIVFGGAAVPMARWARRNASRLFWWLLMREARRGIRG